MQKDIFLKDISSSSFTKVLESLGFKRLTDLDFRDDGMKFRMYSYKGLPFHFARDPKRKTLYLSIRTHYCSEEELKDKGLIDLLVDFDWWLDYTVQKEKTVVNFFTKEEEKGCLYDFGQKYNGKTLDFSVGWLIGICEAFIEEIRKLNNTKD